MAALFYIFIVLAHLAGLYIISRREVSRYFVSKDNEMNIPWTLLFCVWKLCLYTIACFLSYKLFGLIKGQSFFTYKLAEYNQYTTVINYTHEKTAYMVVFIIPFLVLLPGKYLVMKQALYSKGWYLFPGIIYSLFLVLFISITIIAQAFYNTSSI